MKIKSKYLFCIVIFFIALMSIGSHSLKTDEIILIASSVNGTTITVTEPTVFNGIKGQYLNNVKFKLYANTTFKNIKFHNTSIPIEIKNSFDEFIIEDCSFDSITNDCVYLNDYEMGIKFVKIKNTTITNSQSGIRLTGHNQKIIIENLDITNLFSDSVSNVSIGGVWLDSDSLVKVSECDINYMYNGAESEGANAIQAIAIFARCPYVYVYNNRIFNVSNKDNDDAEAIYVKADSVFSIYNNKIFNAGTSDASITTKFLTAYGEIYNNTIIKTDSNITGGGILVKSPTRIFNNRIELNNGGPGIRIVAEDSLGVYVLHDNEITSNGYGVIVGNRGGFHYYQNNIITSKKQKSIHMDFSTPPQKAYKVVIKNNLLNSNSTQASHISVNYSDTLIVAGNEFFGNTDSVFVLSSGYYKFKE